MSDQIEQTSEWYLQNEAAFKMYLQDLHLRMGENDQLREAINLYLTHSEQLQSDFTKVQASKQPQPPQSDYKALIQQLEDKAQRIYKQVIEMQQKKRAECLANENSIVYICNMIRPYNIYLNELQQLLQNHPTIRLDIQKYIKSLEKLPLPEQNSKLQKFEQQIIPKVSKSLNGLIMAKKTMSEANNKLKQKKKLLKTNIQNYFQGKPVFDRANQLIANQIQNIELIEKRSQQLEKLEAQINQLSYVCHRNSTFQSQIYQSMDLKKRVKDIEREVDLLSSSPSLHSEEEQKPSENFKILLRKQQPNQYIRIGLLIWFLVLAGVITKLVLE